MHIPVDTACGTAVLAFEEPPLVILCDGHGGSYDYVAKPICERPQGAALLAVLKPGDAIITPKLDRMFRSALDALGVLADLKERGSLHMIDLGGDVTGNGISNLVFTILSAVAEAERDPWNLPGSWPDLEQALVCCRVSLTFGAHGFGPELFAGIYVFAFDCAEANVTYV